MPSETVPVTVVICARNREDMIARCLDSVLAANPAEVIVVDGNSTDHTAEIAREKGIKVVSDEGRGLGAARQLGGRLAAYDPIVFVDSDTVIRPDTLRNLLSEATEERYDALQAELHSFSGANSYWQEASAWRKRVQMPKGLTNLLGCQATLVRKDLLMRVGFDPAFSGSAEDADFCLRARASGARIAHSARAVAYHEDRQSLSQFIRQQIWYGQGLARMMVRYRRNYADKVYTRARSAQAAARFNPKYVPFILVSWSFAVLGTSLELFNLVRNPNLRQMLSGGNKAG